MVSQMTPVERLDGTFVDDEKEEKDPPTVPGTQRFSRYSKMLLIIQNE